MERPGEVSENGYEAVIWFTGTGPMKNADGWDRKFFFTEVQWKRLRDDWLGYCRGGVHGPNGGVYQCAQCVRHRGATPHEIVIRFDVIACIIGSERPEAETAD